MNDEEKKKELITQEAWCERSMPAKPLESKIKRWFALMLKRFIVAKPRVDRTAREGEKRHKQDGLKRMEQLALILWALTSRGTACGIKQDKGEMRVMASSMRELSDMCVTSVELFRNARAINGGATFLQKKVKVSDFIIKDGGSLDAVFPNLCYQAIFLWLLAGYAQLKEEECDPDNYGYANVRLAKDTAWEWVEYLSDAIELVASLEYERLK